MHSCCTLHCQNAIIKVWQGTSGLFFNTCTSERKNKDVDRNTAVVLTGREGEFVIEQIRDQFGNPQDVFRGPEPRYPEDFAALKRAGMKTLLNLESTPWFGASVEQLAPKYGLNVIRIPIIPFPFPLLVQPSRKKIEAAVNALMDPKLRPIYVHCLLGDDRTGIVVALYQIYANNMSAEDAERQMRSYNMQPSWFLPGLSEFYETYKNPKRDDQGHVIRFHPDRKGSRRHRHRDKRKQSTSPKRDSITNSRNSSGCENSISLSTNPQQMHSGNPAGNEETVDRRAPNGAVNDSGAKEHHRHHHHQHHHEDDASSSAQDVDEHVWETTLRITGVYDACTRSETPGKCSNKNCAHADPSSS